MKQFFKSMAPKATLSAILLSFSALVCAEVAVIVHPSVAASASANDIERLFLGKTKSLGGTKLVPLNLDKGTPARDEFNEKVLKKSDSQLKSYWSRLVFTGKAQPPKTVASEAEAVQLVSTNPNMIAYVSNAAVSADVKVLASF